MLIVQMMYPELMELTEDEQRRRLQDYTLCYDNICNVDALGAAKEDLPLPGPLSDIWKTVKKAIDRLHIRNHKDQKCHELYHPDDNLPSSYNTMAGEQTFAWMSRFKKIVNSMTQMHHLFFLHRMCVKNVSILLRPSVDFKNIAPAFHGINSFEGITPGCLS